jgi:hypothetical protein
MTLKATYKHRNEKSTDRSFSHGVSGNFHTLGSRSASTEPDAAAVSSSSFMTRTVAQ